MSDYESYGIGWGTTKTDAIKTIRTFIELDYRKFDMKVIKFTQGKVYPFNGSPGEPNRYFSFKGIVEYTDPVTGLKTRIGTHGEGHYSTEDEWQIGVRGYFDLSTKKVSVKKRRN